MYDNIHVLPIENITVDPRLQVRAATSAQTAWEYADALKDGTALPPVTVFYDGQTYWLADGFHRVDAAKRAGIADMDAEVREGSFRDALRYALGANATHGLQRTNADKRRAVEIALADPEWGAMSNRKIAELCAVSHAFVNILRDDSGNVSTPHSLTSIDIGGGNVSTPSPVASGDDEGVNVNTPAHPRPRIIPYRNKYGDIVGMNPANIGRRRASGAVPPLSTNTPQPSSPPASSAPPPDPLVCPFCGYDQYRVEGIEYDMFAALCYRCNARGPAGRDENEAESVWFQRFLPGS